MIQFTLPWLLLLIPLPWLMRLFWHHSHSRLSALEVPFFSPLKQQIDEARQGKILLRLSYRVLLPMLIWTLCVIAAANPIWLGKPISFNPKGRDLMLAIDLSGSMRTDDMRYGQQDLSRLMVTKVVADNFIKQRVGDRVGLVLFGSRAYLQTPLTFDRTTVMQLLNDATVGLAGIQTAIGDAIGIATKHLLDKDRAGRAIILLTDGANNAGSIAPIAAAKLAKKAGIKIYTIGLGAGQQQVQSWFGMQTIGGNRDLDTNMLKAVAQMTGGEYFRAQDGQALQHIYQSIDKLEPRTSDSVMVRPKTPLYPWPLGLALGLTLFAQRRRLYKPIGGTA